MDIPDCEWIREDFSGDLIFHCPLKNQNARIAKSLLKFNGSESSKRLAHYLSVYYQSQFGCAECDGLQLPPAKYAGLSLISDKKEAS